MSKTGYRLYRTFIMLLSVVMAGFIFLSTFLTITLYTFGNEKYINKQLSKSTACKEQTSIFYDKLDIISAEYEIPDEILQNAMTHSQLASVGQMAMRALITQKDFSIKQIESIERYFANALNEYSSKNNNCLSDELIYEIVDKVSDAVDETYRIQNVSDFKLLAGIINSRRLSLLDVICIVATLGVGALLFIMMNGRTAAIIYFGIAFAGAGETCIAFPLCYRYLNVGKNIAMTTIDAYNQVLSGIMDFHQQAMIIVGAVFILIAIIFFVTANNHYKPILKNADIEREFEKNLL